jgi:fatty acid desaturase
MLPKVITVSTFSVGVGTAGAGMMQWFWVPPQMLQGLSFVIVSLPMLMLSWYLWAINDVVETIQASPGTPAQKLAEVHRTLEPIMALLKMTTPAGARAEQEA